MLKYNYYLKDKIEDYLQAINGVYNRLVLVVQKNNATKEIQDYLVHSNNGIITEYKKIQ